MARPSIVVAEEYQPITVRRRIVGSARRIAWALLVAGLGSCEREAPVVTSFAGDEQPSCPAGPVAAAFAPGVDARLELGATWLPAVGDDPVLADAERLAAHRLRTSGLPGGAGDPWRAAVGSEGELADARRRALSFHEEVRRGELVEHEPGAVDQATAIIERAEPVDHARLVVVQTQLHCTPSEGGYFRLPDRDPAFDRNACTTLHPGEMLRVLARADAGRWLLVDAGHTSGWVRPAGLSERLTEDARRAWRGAERVWALADDVRTRGGVPLRMGVGLPVVSRTTADITVQVAAASGPTEDVLDARAAITVGFAPLRRGSVLAAAFAQIGAAYGWGGRGGARDCSQFLRDTLIPFGLELPRHSSAQAESGFTTVEVAGWSAADKLAEIDRASRTGLVLEYMPGHVLLDIGAWDGRRWSISSIAEFLVPCPQGGGDTLYRLDRVAVTDLELGRGTARGAFVDRITKLAVFGSSP